jgi:hypothetical protein
MIESKRYIPFPLCGKTQETNLPIFRQSPGLRQIIHPFLIPKGIETKRLLAFLYGRKIIIPPKQSLLRGLGGSADRRLVSSSTKNDALVPVKSEKTDKRK